jgi:DNA (cytosine-5)-methyltransferase 1
MEIDLLELFSGIGGFAKGLQEAGFKIKKHQYSEIDKHAIANYKYNFKKSEYVGSVTDVRGSGIERPDIITFGSPCQDFSMAGKQLGMEGQRSVLILEAIRIIRECKPSVFIWENVKGAFSSNNGADFWAILNAFTNIGGYRLEWQLLNTSWVLPQNRERIYLVGHLTGRSTGQIFPFRENDKVFNRPKQSKKARTQTEYSTTLKASGVMKADDTFIKVPKIGACLTGGGNSGGLHSDMTVIPVLTPNRLEKRQNGRRFKEDGDPAFTLNCQDQHGIMIKSNIYGKHHQDRFYDTDGLMACITSARTEDKIKIQTENKIRRLTEIECERLQGFPDDWTRYGDYDGVIKEICKTQRYKMCGNAVSTKMVKAIGQRIKLVK